MGAGQGGNDLLGNKAQVADQKEKYGNIALVRFPFNLKYKLP